MHAEILAYVRVPLLLLVPGLLLDDHPHTCSRALSPTQEHMHTYTHARTHTRAHTHTHTRTHTQMHTHTHANTHTQAHKQTHTHANTHTTNTQAHTPVMPLTVRQQLLCRQAHRKTAAGPPPLALCLQDPLHWPLVLLAVAAVAALAAAAAAAVERQQPCWRAAAAPKPRNQPVRYARQGCVCV